MQMVVLINDAPTSNTAMADSLISPRQCRAARAWLGWTQRELAVQAGLDMQTVMNFEIGRGVPHKATAMALMMVFLRAGIQQDEQQNLLLPMQAETSKL
jgi:DNA-binding XRE family transcriptional regulator